MRIHIVTITQVTDGIFLQGRFVTTLFIHRELQGTWTFGIRRLLPPLQRCGGVVYIIIYI